MLKHRIAAILTIAAGILGATANAAPTGYPSPTINSTIDPSQLVTLVGNTRRAANPKNDLGIVKDSLPLGHLYLQMKRSPEREEALKQYIDQLNDPKSSEFHQWLTPSQFAEHYGVDAQDVQTVKTWLKSQGFKVHGSTQSGLLIDFSGTAGQVRNALHTELHYYNVGGKTHLANASDPKIPEALAPAVAGVVSLHDFHPRAMNMPKTTQGPAYTSGTKNDVVPGDIATIYNLNPLFAQGYSGQGQSIMVLEDTYLYTVEDWTIFRKTFGLSRAYPQATLSQVSPTGGVTCTNPGFQGVSTDPGYGDDGEAAIDVEWASAAAPNAAIILAACTDGATVQTFGGLLALENVLNGPVSGLPSVVSMSYGESEADDGAAGNLAFYTTFQQAAAEGVSIFVSSGDEDAASTAGGEAAYAYYGISISGWTSTPYNVSVGGLDFGYTADGVAASTYWNSTNSNTYESAKSYIQEIPWNNSCAGALITAYLDVHDTGKYGITATTTPSQLCNLTARQVTGYQDSVGGSGGPSACATGTPSVSDTDGAVVGGTCAGYPKPSWQSVVGNPADGVRDIPDVALFASNGFWNAYYVVCWSDTAGGGASCQGKPSAWAGFGGTSISSPIMAAIQALANQYTKETWGNPNPAYYALASTEYGASGSSTCNSTTVTKTGNACVFYDITQGDIDSICKLDPNDANANFNCYFATAGTTYGILSTSTTADQPAYLTNTGWDFGSGIGSVNAYNFVTAFAAYEAAHKKK
jgi:subtilase family serine protease